jgi:hypothetical protein
MPLVAAFVIGWLGAAAVAQTAPTERVLFVGNSLTLANGLVAMVEALSRAEGHPIQTEMVAFGGYSLEDHWDKGAAKRALAAGGWSVIVLQQGPSSQPEGHEMLRTHAGLFAREARKVQTRVALYMVWPPRGGPGSFREVSDSYRRAAKSVDGLLLPVGDAFAAALKLNSRMPLMGTDGFHPTTLGTYLAAIVIHQRLSGRQTPFVPLVLESPTQTFPRIQISQETADLLAAAATTASAIR